MLRDSPKQSNSWLCKELPYSPGHYILQMTPTRAFDFSSALSPNSGLHMSHQGSEVFSALLLSVSVKAHGQHGALESPTERAEVTWSALSVLLLMKSKLVLVTFVNLLLWGRGTQKTNGYAQSTKSPLAAPRKGCCYMALSWLAAISVGVGSEKSAFKQIPWHFPC